MFETLDELWMDAIKQLKKGKPLLSRDGPSIEILGYTAKLKNPNANVMFNPVRNAAPYYAAAELLWYLSGETKIDMIKYYAPQYERFADNGCAFGAYGYRWKNDLLFKEALFDTARYGPVTSQLDAIVSLLESKPATRQAVMTCWNAGDLPHAIIGDKRDLPCTLAMNFILREKLYLAVTMRSNDIWLGLPYDVFAFTCIQQLIAEALEVECGWYQHNVMSLHLYERDKAKAFVKQPEFETGPIYYKRHNNVLEDIEKAIETEKFMRSIKNISSDEELNKGSLLYECLMMIGTKWDGELLKEYRNVNSRRRRQSGKNNSVQKDGKVSGKAR